MRRRRGSLPPAPSRGGPRHRGASSRPHAPPPRPAPRCSRSGPRPSYGRSVTISPWSSGGLRGEAEGVGFREGDGELEVPAVFLADGLDGGAAGALLAGV